MRLGGLLRRLRAGLRRLARRAAEKVLGRTYDGASPPPRLVDEVMAFSALHPGARPAEWEAFALGLAAGAWRDGFAYGVEWRERIGEPAPFDEAALTEEERRLRGWTAPGIRVEGDPLADVPPERRAEVLQEIEFAAGYGGFRFVDAETLRPIFPPAAMPAAEEDADDGDEGAGEEGGDDEGGAGGG